MTLGELSQRMMVSNGNVTGLVDRLVAQGLLARRRSPNDRRSQFVSLTAEGRRAFRTMARANATGWRTCSPSFCRTRSNADAPPRQGQGIGAQSGQRERLMTAANPVTLPLSGYQGRHVRFEVAGKVAMLTLNRPERKNPLTFESYDEIAGIFRAAAKDKGVKAFVVTGAGGNFCWAATCSRSSARWSRWARRACSTSPR